MDCRYEVVGSDGGCLMFVRSSRFHDALVQAHDASRAEAKFRVEAEMLRTELEHERAEHREELTAVRSEASELIHAARRELHVLAAEHDAEISSWEERLNGEHLHTLIGKNVVAHIPSADLSIEGVLVGVYKDTVTLRHARIPLTGTGDVQPVGGDQNIPRDKVAWVTELPPEIKLPRI